MSESDGEQAARSVALEQAYVHEVYEQCAEKTAQSRHWPRIYEFLEELEPGALVCDVGCGNGKYLSVNQSIFKVGVDRCRRLTDIAREKENEVLICDNLALPFRDDSFDAVLSIAVVHHFATTERRVHALKELARVLRIGGKLVISVWAMEQRHRKFESQDVLVPWPKAYCLSSTSNGIRPSGIPYADEIQHNQITHKDLLTSKRASQKKYRNKSYWIDPVFSPSPSTSSLSSPNETCYSFVRRALQKLAGGKRGGPGSRPWFLETWHNGVGKERRHLQHDDSGDVDDLPIELRRLEDINVTMNKLPDTLSVKSKSLGDILEVQRLDLVRSRSSIPGLCSTMTSDSFLDEQSKTPPLSSSKPRLVKQKSYFIDDVTLDIPENTAIQELIKDLPDFQTAPRIPGRRGNVHKQSSMNEELMSIERLKEKEKVRRNIMKQASLNEEIICKRKAFEAFKDSLYSGNATKRFQLLKSGLTNKIKQSTTNIEKVSGMSIKNGFVRMLQGWKSGDTPIPATSTMNCDDPVSPIIKTSDKLATTVKRDGADCIERRLSREDGSDSSKDSSLQSDTSVDSEDSFASVIYVPKPEMSSIIDVMTTVPPGYQITTASAPPSPRVKHPPDFSGPRLKLIPVSPLSKQFPATSKSLPPTSPPGLSPHTLNSIPGRLFFSSFSATKEQAPIFDKFIRPKESESSFLKSNQEAKPTVPKCTAVLDACQPDEPKPVLQPIPSNETKDSDAKAMNTDELVVSETSIHVPVVTEILPSVQEKSSEKSSMESINEEENRKARLNQIKELLKQKPGFATRCAKPSFPLVRRASAAAPGRLETVARPLPRLLSLELFNPETDDLDSDSSGVSSPESVGSVISVISDERFTVKKDNSKLEENSKGASDSLNGKLNASGSTTTDFSHSDDIKYESLASRSQDGSSPEISSASSQSIRLLEAAANVASSLEDAVGTAIQLKPYSNSYSVQPQRHISIDGSSSYESSWRNSASPTELQELLEDSKQSFSLDEKTWNEECRQHLIDFTEKLSENLIHDIDQYCQKTELEFNDDFTSKQATTDIFGSNAQSKKADAFVFESMAPPYVPGTLLTEASESCKYSELVDTIAWLNKSNNGSADPEIDNKPSNCALGLECSNADISSQNVINNVLMHRSRSEDIMDFVLVSNNGEFINDEEIVSKDGQPIETNLPPSDLGQVDITGKPYLRFGNSIESSDIGDSIENTTSFSECSQTESFRESITAEKTDNGSTASLGSMDMECSTDRKAKSKLQTHTIRSGLDEAASPGPAMNEEASGNSECNGTLSESSSQESLPSDHGGGAITYHQYYHVFREGELDQLINKYVENLHIISSYYDHASWCIVAEKVQVWTI